MPMDRSRYPSDWPAISLRIRERDHWRCRWCGARQGEPHPDTGSKVVLTVAHLNHDTQDNDETNLMSLCQRCHNAYDRPMRLAHARVARAAKKGGQLPLPLQDMPGTGKTARRERCGN